MLFLRARWYAPGEGIFLSRDPVESEPPYQYVRGNPINQVDPSGLKPPSSGNKSTLRANECEQGSCKIEVQMRNIGLATAWFGYHAAVIFTDANGHQTEHSAYPSEAQEGNSLSNLFNLASNAITDPGLPWSSTPPPTNCKTIEEALLTQEFASPMCETYYYYYFPPRGGESRWGVIEPHNAEYNERSKEWDPGAPIITVAEGTEYCEKKECIIETLERIGMAQIPYAFLGPNSNSSVATTLQRCNLPVIRPTIYGLNFIPGVGVAPGWWIRNLLSAPQMYGGK